MVPSHRVRIHEDAADELDRIYQFISRDNPKNARRFLGSLKAKLLSLNSFPKRGTRCHLVAQSDVFSDLRFISYNGYLIFYDVTPKEVVVLHVTGPGQAWIEFFL